jgi:hypothetical protein
MSDFIYVMKPAARQDTGGECSAASSRTCAEPLRLCSLWGGMTEIAAIERAELGDLSGRAAQAVLLTRQDASPVQVAAADTLAGSLLGGDQLLTLDPTAACGAAAHWLYA